MNLKLTIKLLNDFTEKNLAKRVSFIVEILYYRLSEVQAINTSVYSSVRVDDIFDDDRVILLRDYDRSQEFITINLLLDDGSLLTTIQIKHNNEEVVFRLDGRYYDLIRRDLRTPNVKDVKSVFIRNVHLIDPGKCSANVNRCSVNVALLNKEALSSLVNEIKNENVKNNSDDLFTIRLDGESIKAVTGYIWNSARLNIDGSFTAEFTINENLLEKNRDNKDLIGWLWWLNGDHQIVGYVPDDFQNSVWDLSLALPLFVRDVQTENDDQIHKPHDCKSGCNHSIEGLRLNATEAEIANNPQVFSEDPGTFCKPFSNPERILSEKTFSVVTRVTQPEIGPQSSINLITASHTNLKFNIIAKNITNRELVKLFKKPLLKPFNPVLDFALVPKVETNQTVVELSPAIKKMYDKMSNVRKKLDSNNPVQWEQDAAQYQATTIALGHILEFRVRWRSNGYSLGTVAHTLTLAPRQARRIQKIEWSRRESAKRSERTRFEEEVNDSINQVRDYDNTVASNLEEWSAGGSISTVAGFGAGIGTVVGSVLAGFGAAAGSAASASAQSGGRNVTASENQRLRDSIRRHGDSLRNFNSTVVSEMRQDEVAVGTTEVIRNVNYAHSLTVIYYQILRHLKVTTEFGGVQECVFVPFAIKPFNIERIYKWRESLRLGAKSQKYRLAFEHLKDVITKFQYSNIPDKARADLPMTSLSGSIYIQLAIERPKDKDDGKYNETAWDVLKNMLANPPLGVFSYLASLVPQNRDTAFQANYAREIARRWADGLKLKIGTVEAKIDATLASAYVYNGIIKIDFVVSEPQKFTRRVLQKIILKAKDLPKGSVANFKSITFDYSTEQFNRSVYSGTSADDLINADGASSPESAEISLPIDPWESVNVRQSIIQNVSELIEHLNENVEYYHKQIWLRMDRDRLRMMLDGFYVPNTNNLSIASIVNSNPLAIVGNCLVFKVSPAAFIGYGDIKDTQSLYNYYKEQSPSSDPLHISVPTGGLYAQTIMDECNALEEHFGNQDWVLQDKDPQLDSIDPALLGSRRADTTAVVQPTQFPASIINLQNAQTPPPPSGLQGVLNAVTSADSFLDRAGLEGTQDNAINALRTAANIANNFGAQAASLEFARLENAKEATIKADQKLASIKRAKDKGLISDQQAEQITTESLNAMNPDNRNKEELINNPAIQHALYNAQNGFRVATMGGTVETKSTSTIDGTLLFDVESTSEKNPLTIKLKINENENSFLFWVSENKKVVQTKKYPTGLSWPLDTVDLEGSFTVNRNTTTTLSMQFNCMGKITVMPVGISNATINIDTTVKKVDMELTTIAKETEISKLVGGKIEYKDSNDRRFFTITGKTTTDKNITLTWSSKLKKVSTNLNDNVQWYDA